MKSILEELYYGNINPNINFQIDSEEYAEATALLARNEEKLCSLLHGTELDLFLDVINAHDMSMAVSSIEWFSHGFKLGLRFGMEAGESAAETLTDK